MVVRKVARNFLSCLMCHSRLISTSTRFLSGIAQEALEYGWWEAIVIARNGDMLTLRLSTAY